ncbi:MAG TPA: flippase activity-associated protein Agl23 [Candidatus Cybelea sp.]|nr:flippase activity-associated protein Agl23 [Candidatus Cybelea sp.]
MNRWLLAGVALALGVGLGLRAPRLTLRPMHNDEGVNAMNFRHLYVTNNYKYNPVEFHGPTLPYLTLPAAWVQGGGDFNEFSEATYRSVTVAFGLGLIALWLMLAPDLGRGQIIWAAVFTAISPAMVFYSRYYIHEMLLVFFTAWTFICAWRWANSGRAVWAVAGGLGLGLMYATKETFVFTLAAMGLAVGSSALWGRWRAAAAPGFQPQRNWRHVLAALAVAAVTAIVFFSSFFTNRAGPLDAVRTYLPWLKRAGGATEHVHPWYFYFQRLLWFHDHGGPFWSEGWIVALALVGFCGALHGRALLPRLIAFYTLWLTLFYTVLPYKTPWCLLGFYHGMILLAGAGVMLLWRMCRPVCSKTGLAIALTAGVTHLAWQSYRGNFGVDSKGAPFCDSAKNPYVYSQTLPDALRLTATVDALAHVSAQGYGSVVEVMSAESYWPLPWYLRRFSNVGYWDVIPKPPPIPIASVPIMIVSTELHAAFDEGPGKTHLMAGYFALRPQVFMELYVQTNLWAAYVKTLPPEKD